MRHHCEETLTYFRVVCHGKNRGGHVFLKCNGRVQKWYFQHLLFQLKPNFSKLRKAKWSKKLSWSYFLRRRIGRIYCWIIWYVCDTSRLRWSKLSSGLWIEGKDLQIRGIRHLLPMFVSFSALLWRIQRDTQLSCELCLKLSLPQLLSLPSLLLMEF